MKARRATMVVMRPTRMFCQASVGSFPGTAVGHYRPVATDSFVAIQLGQLTAKLAQLST